MLSTARITVAVFLLLALAACSGSGNKAALNNAEARIDVLTGEKAALENEKAVLENEKATLEAAVVEAEGRLRTLRADAATTQAQLSAATTELERLRGVLIEADTRIADLQKQLDIAAPPGLGYAVQLSKSLNALSEEARSGVIWHIGSASTREPVSNAGKNFGEFSSNTGVTQSSRSTDNRALNAEYINGQLEFENVSGANRPPSGTTVEIDADGYRQPVEHLPGGWTGVEHGAQTTSLGRFRNVFLSDITNNGDTDYLVLGVWSWTPNYADLEDTRSPSFGAAASGNDPFTGDIQSLKGRATYTGPARGAYAMRDAAQPFGSFLADVELTAAFEDGSIFGAVLNGEDTISGTTVFDSVVLRRSDIEGTFVNGRTTAVLNGQVASGDWGAQFFGNDGATPPGSIAGTFGVRTRNWGVDGAKGTAAVLGAFGAYRE